MATRRFIVAVLLTVFSLGGCGGGGSSGGSSSSTNATPPPATYKATSGVAQKGPLILGSTVTAQALDASLNPTGQQYSYQTTTNLGTFDATANFTSQYIGVIATGYYFDEVTNAISDGTITLYAYSDLSAASVLNVNLLTTLAYQRMQNLVANNGMTFAAAEAQAESEVLAAFSIHNPSGYGTFSTLDLSKGTDGDHILAALSSIFLYGNTSGNTAALIAGVQSDIGANGAITDAGTQAQILAAAQSVDSDAITIAANLTAEYASEAISFSATNITDWVDQDGDGLTGRFKFNAPRSPQASTFTFPLYVTDPWAGLSLSATAGQLYLNGNAVTGPITPAAGDEISVGPPAGFSAGVLTVYLLNGTTKVGRVSFYGHGTWSPAANMITPRGGFAAAMLPNGTVFVVGGCPLAFPGGGCTSVSSALPSEIYNPASDSWTTAATEPTNRTGATATLLTSGPNAGQVLVVGGWVYSYSGGSLSSAAELTAELYDPATDSWAPGGLSLRREPVIRPRCSPMAMFWPSEGKIPRHILRSQVVSFTMRPAIAGAPSQVSLSRSCWGRPSFCQTAMFWL